MRRLARWFRSALPDAARIAIIMIVGVTAVGLARWAQGSFAPIVSAQGAVYRVSVLIILSVLVGFLCIACADFGDQARRWLNRCKKRLR